MVGQEDFDRCPDCNNKAKQCAELIAGEFSRYPDDGMDRFKQCAYGTNNCEDGMLEHLLDMLPESVSLAMRKMDLDEQEEFLQGNAPDGYRVLLNVPPADDTDTKVIWTAIAPVVQAEIKTTSWDQARLKQKITAPPPPLLPEGVLGGP